MTRATTDILISGGGVAGLAAAAAFAWIMSIVATVTIKRLVALQWSLC
jgi:succinate dehydrogenase/fumarate reductase flavoprotein subunit